MSASRPEHLDIHGLAHRYGCKASRVTVRPSFVRAGWVYLACRDCHAVGSVEDTEEEEVVEP